MPDDSQKTAALAAAFRRKLADASLSLETLKTHADTALAALLDGTTIIGLSFEGGGTNAAVNCDPAIVLDAANMVIAEQDTDAIAGTGAIDLDMSRRRIET